MPSALPTARALLRIAIAITAVVAIVGGDILYGMYCLVSLALTTGLSKLAQRAGTSSPIMIDLALLWLMLADMTLGTMLGLYLSVPWFDKALHVGGSTIIGMLGFLVIYVVHVTGRIRFHPIIDGVAILLVTLGLGAFWEVAEFAVDHLLGRATQGSPRYDALDDTMIDLILDGAGGVIAAIVGPLYMQRSKASRRRVEAIAAFIAERARLRPRRAS